MRIENDMNAVEGEAVARQANRNRAWTQIDANLRERDRPGRCGVRLAPRSGKKLTERHVFGETPNTAVETTALPTDRISEHSRILASIRGSMRNSLISKIGLMQVVDFHDIFRYFSWFLWCPFAVMLQFLIFENHLMQVVDFHDSFSYFWHVFGRKPGESSASRFFGEAKDDGRSGYNGRAFRAFLNRKCAPWAIRPENCLQKRRIGPELPIG